MQNMNLARNYRLSRSLMLYLCRSCKFKSGILPLSLTTVCVKSKLYPNMSLATSSSIEKSPLKSSPKKAVAGFPLKEISIPQTDVSLLGNEQQKRKLDVQGSMVKQAKLKPSRPFTISVEGNIGSGKSTFLKYFSSEPGVTTFQEPISKWTDVGGHNLLQKMYDDPKRWSFLFQSYVQLTRLQIHLDNSTPGLKIIERSFHNNRFCFVENAYNSGNLKPAEYEVLCEYYDVLEKHLDIGVDLIVYIKTTPQVVYERMKNRGRREEASVHLEYLQKLHNSYEKWLKKGQPTPPSCRVVTMNGDLDLESIVNEYAEVKRIILGMQTKE